MYKPSTYFKTHSRQYQLSTVNFLVMKRFITFTFLIIWILIASTACRKTCSCTVFEGYDENNNLVELSYPEQNALLDWALERCETLVDTTAIVDQETYAIINCYYEQ